MSRAATTRSKRSRGEAFSISSPSTFRSADFQVKETKSTCGLSKTNPSLATLTNSEKRYLQVHPEKDLWNQVLNIRQLVSRMQASLEHLNSDLQVDENLDLDSQFDLSKELSSEDSYDSADEESIINLEGILVHVSTSDTSSSEQEEEEQADDAYDAASCVSSLGLGGHETTTPIHISSSIARGNLVSPVYSSSAAIATAEASTPIASSRRIFYQDTEEDDDASSVESLTTMHFFKIFYYFLLEFPVHFYTFLTESSSTTSPPKNISRSKSPRSKRRQTARYFLYTLLTLFILGCVIWKQCPTCFEGSTKPVPQSCVTPTVLPITPRNESLPADFAAPLLSVHHAIMRSSKIKISQPSRIVSRPSESVLLLEEVVEEGEAEVDLPIVVEDIVTAPQEESIVEEVEAEVDPPIVVEEIVTAPQEESIQEEPTIPKNPLVQMLQDHGKKLVQRVAKNHHKMWDQYPSPAVPTILEPNEQGVITKRPPLAALQEKGQQVLQKLAQNQDKMWDQYPTPLPKKGTGGFLQKTANMWANKPSNHYTSENKL